MNIKNLYPVLAGEYMESICLKRHVGTRCVVLLIDSLILFSRSVLSLFVFTVAFCCCLRLCN